MLRRAPAFIAVLALCGLFLGGAIWLRASLASAFAKGESYGRTQSAAQAAAALSSQTAALEAIRRRSEIEAAGLEVEREQLREKFDELDKLLAAAPGGVAPGAAHCLDAGVVRALDALRGRGGAPASSP